MTEKKQKILIVDDELDNRQMVVSNLSESCTVLTAADGEEGFQIASKEIPDLVLLDIVMPKLNGIALCEKLRNNERTRHIPIIMLSGAHDVDMRVRSFLTGADDFLPKPFVGAELKARVLSKLRREKERSPEGSQIICGNLILDIEKILATIDSKPIKLSVLEFELVRFFVERKEKVISRQVILEAIWKDVAVTERTIDAHLVTLRKKLSGFDHAIESVYGAGYVLKKS